MYFKSCSDKNIQNSLHNIWKSKYFKNISNSLSSTALFCRNGLQNFQTSVIQKRNQTKFHKVNLTPKFNLFQTSADTWQIDNK